MKEILPRDIERHRHVQHDLEHHNNQGGIRHAKSGCQRPRCNACQPVLQKIREHSSRPQAQKRD